MCLVSVAGARVLVVLDRCLFARGWSPLVPARHPDTRRCYLSPLFYFIPSSRPVANEFYLQVVIRSWYVYRQRASVRYLMLSSIGEPP